MPRQRGDQYVIVDSELIHLLKPMRWQELRYRPQLAHLGGEQIVVRARGLSNAWESVMQADWFLAEAHARTQHCDFPILVTTANDGDNGGWFRRTRSNF